MFCKYCGKQIADDSVFCSSCGKSLKEDATPSPNSIETNGNPAPAEKKEAKATGSAKPGKVTIGELFTRPLSILYLVLALLCMIPLGFAEYRRLVEGVALDGMYWLMASPVLLSVLFGFLIIGPSAIAETKAEDQKVFEETGYRGSHVVETVCNTLFAVIMPIAILCFIISGIVTLLG